jgi:hypothetical protein
MLAGGFLLVALAFSLAACSSTPENQNSSARQASPAPRPALAADRPTPTPQTAQSSGALALSEARSKSHDQQRDLIRDLILDGVFASIELQEGTPRVQVKPGFYLLTFKDQQLYMAVVYAFAYPEGGTEGDKVVVLDSVSGQEKGAFTEDGLHFN